MPGEHQHAWQTGLCYDLVSRWKGWLPDIFLVQFPAVSKVLRIRLWMIMCLSLYEAWATPRWQQGSELTLKSTRPHDNLLAYSTFLQLLLCSATFSSSNTSINEDTYDQAPSRLLSLSVPQKKKIHWHQKQWVGFVF